MKKVITKSSSQNEHKKCPECGQMGHPRHYCNDEVTSYVCHSCTTEWEIIPKKPESNFDFIEFIKSLFRMDVRK